MKEERRSQKRLILNYLLEHGSITPLLALKHFGCMRLGARISDLRDEGYHIQTIRTEAVSSVTGNRVCYATYKLVE